MNPSPEYSAALNTAAAATAAPPTDAARSAAAPAHAPAARATARTPASTGIVRQLLAPLASLRLTVVLLALSMLLVYAGTWAQIDASIWKVQKQYFHSLVTWVDFQVFLPRPAAGERGIPGGFPMPGGYLLGLLLLINLTVAHVLRFKCTWRDFVLVPLLAAMLVPLLVWQYSGADWLAHLVAKVGIDLAAIPFPLFVWVVLLSAIVGLPFYVALFLLHGRRGGVIMIHLGLLMLLVGEGITSGMQVERQMQIDEGGYANFAYDTRRAELAVVEEGSAQQNRHTVIPASMLEPGQTIRDARLPFDVSIDEYYPNSDIGSAQQVAPKATHGSGVGAPVFAVPRFKGTDSNQTDLPSAYVTLSKAGQPLGKYLFTVLELAPRFAPIHRPQPVTVDGKTYQVQLRFQRQYRPYKVHLIDFVHDRYTGTDLPKDFASLVRIEDPQQREDREVRIWMNHPLRYRGETFFQSSFKPGDRTTILQVVRNPALVLPYAACAIASIGLALHFGLVLREFLRKRALRVAAVGKAPEKALTGSSGANARRQNDAKVGGAPPAPPVAPRHGPAAIFVPAGAVLLALLAVVVCAIPRGASRDQQFDLDAFAKLPVSFNGRVQPFDSVARHSLKVMRGTESAYEPLPLGEGETKAKLKKVPHLQFLLETMSGSDKPRQYKLFRIDHPDVKSMLELKDDQRYFALAELMPHAAKLDAQFARVRDLPRTQRTAFHQAISDLGARLTRFTTLSNVQELHAAAPAAPGHDWETIGAALAAANNDPAKLNPAASALIRIAHAYHDSNPADFNRAVGEYRAAVAPAAPGEVRRAAVETWYNAFSPFFLCCLLYVAVFVLAAASWASWTKPLARAAFGVLLVAVAVHTLGIVTRIYLSGRPPVTNLESSAAFIGWVVVLLGIALERIYRNGVGSVLSAVIGFLTLTIFLNLAKDDTMKVLQAVLDTNFWLWTHVPAITIGYSATFLAWGLGVAYVVQGLFTRKLTAERGKELARMIYGITAFAVLFSFVGTVLGGIWADQSWGRFWGWDPKENGAVLIVLANALLLHARWGGLVRERGLACLAIFGGIVTAWSWFGTNMLGVGLHSYGFMDSALLWLLVFVMSQVLLIALANVPLTWWRSYEGMTGKGSSSSAGDGGAAGKQLPATP